MLASVSCCICREGVSDRKKCIVLFGSAKRVVAVRNSLVAYLRDERNNNTTEMELRSHFGGLCLCGVCKHRSCASEGEIEVEVDRAVYGGPCIEQSL